jgi:hypothetical protein
MVYIIIMKRHFVFLTFVLSVVNIVSSYMIGDILSIMGWFTAAIASLDHFFTLKRNGL